MWVPTKTEALEMFARHFEARHRSGAVLRATETAWHLKNQGDLEGYEVWRDVADRIEQIRNPDAVTARREQESI